MDLFEYLDAQNEPQIWSVSDANRYLRELFETDVILSDLEVEGEISNFTRARSGHLYFTLKDESSQLKCVMWRSSAARLLFDPQEGDQVVAKGNVSIYEASGQVQLYASRLQPAGRGDLAVAFEKLKQQLAAEGLFDGERKKPLPPFPKKIGIVTSLDAAALRDIINVLSRRYPIADVLIAPTLVQGAEAPAGIARGISWLDGREDIDLIIVARGGGSIEDLWAFNDETVARVVAAAQTPIVSGVGHETDFTIIDFVADLRAPTPSAAAEQSTPDLTDVAGFVVSAGVFLDRKIEQVLFERQEKLDVLDRALELLGPAQGLNANRQMLDLLDQRLNSTLSQSFGDIKQRHLLAMTKLEAVNPAATLERGYAIIKKNDGKLASSVSHLSGGDLVEIQLHDGAVSAEIQEGDQNG